MSCWNWSSDSSSVTRGRGKSLQNSFLITDGRLLNTATFVPSTVASATLCVTNRIVFFVFSQISCISTSRRSRVCASRAANGSSISNTSGSITSALAIATRCFIPVESWYVYESANLVSCIMSRYLWDIFARSSEGIPAIFSPNSTLS